MANDINIVFLIGRLTADPVLRYIQGGTSIASFSLANNKTYLAQNEKKEQVSFFTCIAWGKTGEIIAQHCKKGQRIGVEGRLQQQSWTDKEGKKQSKVEIVVENFQFLSANNSEQHDPTKQLDATPEYSFNNQQPAFTDEDILF
jgi:single-strand DNA-binding protein